MPLTKSFLTFSDLSKTLVFKISLDDLDESKRALNIKIVLNKSEKVLKCLNYEVSQKRSLPDFNSRWSSSIVHKVCYKHAAYSP